jgi:hypothetical protein
LLGSAVRAQQIVVGKEPPPLTLEDHLQTGHAWTLVQMGFPEILKAHLKLVAAAKPGKLIPFTRIEVLSQAKPDGSFLEATCGKPARACPEKAAEMERRVLAATLLRALPTHKRVEELYDLDRLELKETGRWAFALTEEYYPDLWLRLRLMGPGRRAAR